MFRCLVFLSDAADRWRAGDAPDCGSIQGRWASLSPGFEGGERE